MRIGVGLWPYRRFGGLTPVEPLQPGPMDVVIPGRSSFTNFSRPFTLAHPDAIFYLACHYRGDPVISIAHGGEPLEIIQQEREDPSGTMSLVAIGRGLTVEEANLTITATGGELDGGACRINEMINMQDPAVGWCYGDHGQGKPIGFNLSGTNGGIIKASYTRRFVDVGVSIGIGGMETLFKGSTISGDEIAYDVSANSGNWILGDGWSVVDNTLVHTGEVESICVIELPESVLGHQGRRAHITCAAGSKAWIGNTNSTTSGVGMVGPNSGYISTGAIGSLRTFAVSAKADVVIGEIQWFENTDPVSWAFCSAPAVNNMYIQPYDYLAPYWTLSMAEVMAEDYWGRNKTNI